MDALRACGHEIKVLEGDTSLFAKLKKFIPLDDQGRPTGLVFNMAYGIQGNCRYTHVPGMLEMAGVPYTGANPLGHSLALDKVVTKMILQSAGIPTPKMCVLSRADDEFQSDFHFPLVVKPRHESTSCGLHLVHNRQELITAVLSVTAQYQQDALVEEFIPGRELCISVMGNERPEVLPFVELDFNGRDNAMLTRDDKFHRTMDEPEKICPVNIEPRLAERIKDIVLNTFRVCQCKDYSRVDLRIDPFGNPYVLEINSMASLGQGGTFVLAARNAGYTFESLINEIVKVAWTRYGFTFEERSQPVIKPESISIERKMHLAA